VLARVASGDWRERAAALGELVDFCARERATFSASVLRVAGDVGARCGDANHKVALAAVGAAGALVGLLRGEALDRAAPLLLPGLAGALVAAARPVSEGANAVLDRVLASGDPAALLAPLAALLRAAGPPRLRAALLEKLAGLLPAAHARRPTAVARHALPAVFALLDDAKPDVKTSAADVLVRAAAALGAAGVLDAARAASLSDAQLEKLRRVLKGVGAQQAGAWY